MDQTQAVGEAPAAAIAEPAAVKLPETAVSTGEEVPEVVEDDLGGWRRMPGGYVVPPPDPRNTFRIGWLR